MDFIEQGVLTDTMVHSTAAMEALHLSEEVGENMAEWF